MYKKYRLHCTSETVRELTCTCTYIYMYMHRTKWIISVPKFCVFVFLFAEKLKEWEENVKCNFLLNHNILESNSY